MGKVQVPKELGDLQKRRERLSQALAQARAIDAKRAKRTDAPDQPARVPVTDPESKVLPNKEGGHAPNYTPTAAVEGHGGLIMDTDVLSDQVESSTTVATVDRMRETFGQCPEELGADGAFGTGPALTGLAERGVEAYIPVDDQTSGEANPADRDDPTTPVAKSDWPKLPRDAQQKNLSKRAFVYDGEMDVYFCPMGRKLSFTKSRPYRRQSADGMYRVYTCESCRHCPLADQCLTGKSTNRRLFRDEHESQRQAMRARLARPEARAVAALRLWRIEGTFGVLKSVMGVRQFLLRGRDKVKTEWLWACTAFNLRKLVAAVLRLRRQFAPMPT
jgi:hypothetical protein